METVAIVGVGLIGGSIARALRQAGFTGRLIGVSSPRTIEQALRLGVIDEALPLEEAAARSDLIYLAQPISKILSTLEELDACVQPGALVTDAGSTKVQIVRTARKYLHRASFLGGHPMAGKESRGVTSSDPDLFRGRPYVLTPPDGAMPASDREREFADWLRKMGARLVFLDPEHHDRVVALASHLPQLLSTALAATLARRPEAEDIRQVAGPGLRDNTRLAMSPYEIWSDILATNAGPIRDALSACIGVLEQLQSELTSEETACQFDRAAKFARSLRNK